jgi:threonine/homoserine/homoserine lactone efflux protein
VPASRTAAIAKQPMPEVTWPLFIIASLALIVTPGQDMILVMSRSIARGLGAILRTSEWLFVALKLAFEQQQ